MRGVRKVKIRFLKAENQNRMKGKTHGCHIELSDNIGETIKRYQKTVRQNVDSKQLILHAKTRLCINLYNGYKPKAYCQKFKTFDCQFCHSNIVSGKVAISLALYTPHLGLIKYFDLNSLSIMLYIYILCYLIIQLNKA